MESNTPSARASAWLPSLMLGAIGGLAAPLLAGNAPSAEPGAGLVEFVEIPGDREFTGRMIARPLQREEMLASGRSVAEIAERQRAAQDAMRGFTIARYVQQTDEYIFEVPGGRHENDVARDLMALDAFQYVEPDWRVFPIGCPNDSLFSNQWHHSASIMQSCDGWDLHTGNPSVSVGICDTGIRTTHEDFLLHRLEGYNAVDMQWEFAGGDIGAVHPHGTMCTGCAASNGDNGVGIAGVGWNLSHRMLRVSNSSGGSSSLSTLQHAARTSVENGDRVASVSYSGVDNNSNLTTASYIRSIGGLLCWSAGNDGRNLTFGNRDDDDILVVGATTSSDAKASFSAYGPFVDLVAPGASVYTATSTSDSSYTSVSGTSFSCPLTAGMCALISSADPGFSADDIESILKQSCDDLGSSGVDNTFGYGRLNTFNAMTLASGGSPPSAEFSGTPTSGVVPLTVAFSDLSSGSPTSWAWDFGDGGTSTAQNPSHTYNAAGSYTVSLTATNDNGADSMTKTGYITVTNGPPPAADFVGNPTSGIVPLTVSFSDLSTESPTSWAWDFGDGGTSTAQNPSHTYNAAGTYTVTLTATNADGSGTETKVDYVTVDPDGPIGEGFILSKSPDFSTDDRDFSRSDTIYILVYSDTVDHTNMRRNWWQLKKRGDKVRQDLTNHGDGTFTASFDLSGLPSNQTSWNFKARLEDRDRVRFQPTATIRVQ